MNKDISSYKVFDDKNSKTEKDEEKGLFNVMEDNMEVENLQKKLQKVQVMTKELWTMTWNLKLFVKMIWEKPRSRRKHS